MSTDLLKPFGSLAPHPNELGFAMVTLAVRYDGNRPMQYGPLS